MIITISSADKMFDTDTHSSFHWTYRPSHGQKLNRVRIVDCVVNVTITYDVTDTIMPLDKANEMCAVLCTHLDNAQRADVMSSLELISSKYYIHIDGIGVTNSYESFSLTGGIDTSLKVGTTNTEITQPTLKIQKPTSEIWKIELARATSSAYTTATLIDSFNVTLEMWYEPEPSDILYKSKSLLT